MSVCPFCKASVSSSHGPCPRCGRHASDHPSIAGTSARTIGDDFGDDDLGGGLDLEKGSATVGHGAAASSYGGGGLDLDDDFDDPMPAGALELDVPHRATSGAPGPGPSLAPAGFSSPPRGPSLSPGSPSRAPGAAASLAPIPDLGPLPSRTSGTQPAVAPHPSGAFPASRSGEHRAVAAPSGPSVAAAASGASLPPAHPSTPSMRVGPTSQPSLPAGPPDGSSQPSIPASSPSLGPSSSPGLPSVSARPAGPSIVARYPEVPAKTWEAPLYFGRVVLRQFELRQDLGSLRRRRSPDVPLYEAALKAYDGRTYTLGLVITCAIVAVMTLLVFFPVIMRFLHAP